MARSKIHDDGYITLAGRKVRYATYPMPRGDVVVYFVPCLAGPETDRQPSTIGLWRDGDAWKRWGDDIAADILADGGPLWGWGELSCESSYEIGDEDWPTVNIPSDLWDSLVSHVSNRDTSKS